MYNVFHRMVVLSQLEFDDFDTTRHILDIMSQVTVISWLSEKHRGVSDSDLAFSNNSDVFRFVNLLCCARCK